jgi:hypothetical protein
VGSDKTLFYFLQSFLVCNSCFPTLSFFQRILGAIEVSWHRLGLIVDVTNKKTRIDSAESGRKEQEEATRRGRDDTHRHRCGADYITSAYLDRGPALNNRLAQTAVT